MDWKAAIGSAKPGGLVPARVPDTWPAGLFMRPMPGHERAKWNELVTSLEESSPQERINAFLAEHMVAYSLCDENGALIFTDSQEDLKFLRARGSNEIDDLCEQATELSHIGEVQERETVKNFETGPGAGSSSDSVSPSASSTPGTSASCSTPPTSPSGTPTGD